MQGACREIGCNAMTYTRQLIIVNMNDAWSYCVSRDGRVNCDIMDSPLDEQIQNAVHEGITTDITLASFDETVVITELNSCLLLYYACRHQCQVHTCTCKRN